MKGNIRLRDFIEQVKNELVESQDKSGNPFYELKGVELEVTFILETKGSVKGKLIVVDVGGETNAMQTHKVKLQLAPIKKHKKAKISKEKNKSIGGGGGFPNGGKVFPDDLLGVVYHKPPKPKDSL